MVTYVQPTLASCLLATCTLYMWILKGVHYIFVVVVNFIFNSWVVYEAIVKILSPIVYGCVLNQNHVHSNCLRMFYPFFKTLDKSWPLGLFLIALLKNMCLTMS
jgi:hypothetical protein